MNTANQPFIYWTSSHPSFDQIFIPNIQQHEATICHLLNLNKALVEEKEKLEGIIRKEKQQK